jgi:exodeoxyribonuclease III
VKVISWNVNGLRSCIGKGFMDFFRSSGADIFCIQETKLQKGDIKADFSGYDEYWHDADKKGYAGTAVFSRMEPIGVSYGIEAEKNEEGRVITLEFEDFFIVNVYVPNSGEELKRLGYRIAWDKLFRKYISDLDSGKPVIACGDFNVAHNEKDIKNASSNRTHAGFTDEERGSFSKLLDAGYTDAFRELYPEARDKYTYWSYRFNARVRNTGWRIDYALISSRIKDKMNGFTIYSDIYGSDHCPIGLDIF